MVVAILGALAAVALMAALGPQVALFMPLIMVAAYALSLAGSWMLTESDPSGVGEDQYGRSRKLIRYSLIVGVISTVLQLGERAMAMPPPVHQGLAVAHALAALIGAIGWIVLIGYLGKLAERVPDKHLAKRAGFLQLTLGGSYVLFLLIGFAGRMLAASMGRPSPVLPCFIGILGLGMLVLLFLYLRMLEQLGKRLKEQAAIAQASWNAVATPQASV